MTKIFTTNGSIEYHLNGKLHRVDGPAMEHANGDKEWYFEGKLHREDGPAVEGADGYKVWYFEGKLHRVDGPAIERANGSKYWYFEGKLHRVDGPAAEYANGDKEWYLDGKLHRVDGPAAEYANGDEYWYLDGKWHRVDGPAVELASGLREWYLEGVSMTEQEHKKRVSKLAEKTRNDCFFISEEWAIEYQILYYRGRDPYDGKELYESYPITWIYYGPHQITIETDSGHLFLSRLAKNYVGLTCRSSNNEYTHPIRMKWKKLIKFLMNH